MKSTFKSSTFKSLTASILSAISLVSIVSLAGPAAANERTGMEGHYVGAGLSAGVTDGGEGNDGRTIGGNVQGRFDVPNAPVSVRGAALFTDSNAAFVPTVSYDLAVNDSTNIYAGGGASLLLNDDTATPLGNRNAFTLTVGVESSLTEKIGVYSDVKWGINAYEGNTADAVSVQMGASYRF